MPLIVTRSPRTRQPQGNASINWSNPLTRGLTALVCPSYGPREFVYNNPIPIEGAPSQNVSAVGRVLVGAAGAPYNGWRVDYAGSATRYDAIAPPITLFGVGCHDQNFGDAFVRRSNGSSSPSYSLGVWYGSARGGFGRVSTTGGSLDFYPETAIFDPRTPTACVLSIGATTTTLYCMQNGVVVDQRSGSTPSGTFAHQFSDEHRCLAFGGGYNGAATVALGGAVYGVAWSEQQAVAWMRDPWQIFAPIERRIWVPSAGSSLPTLSAATYMPGSITTSGFRPRVTAS